MNLYLFFHPSSPFFVHLADEKGSFTLYELRVLRMLIKTSVLMLLHRLLNQLAVFAKHF